MAAPHGTADGALASPPGRLRGVRIDDGDVRQVEANGLRIGYDTVGEGPPLVLLHGASSTAARTSAPSCPASPGTSPATSRTPAATGGRSSMPPRACSSTTSWPTSRRSAKPSASRRSTSRGFRWAARPPWRSRASPGAGAHPRPRGNGHRARAADQRRPSPRRRCPDRTPGPGLGRGAGPTSRSGPGFRGLAAPDAGHRRLRGRPGAAHAGRAPPHRRTGPGRSRRPGPHRAGCPGRRAGTTAHRRARVRRAGLRPRGPCEAPGSLHGGPGRLLPFDRGGSRPTAGE